MRARRGAGGREGWGLGLTFLNSRRWAVTALVAVSPSQAVLIAVTKEAQPLSRWSRWSLARFRKSASLVQRTPRGVASMPTCLI